MTNGELRLVSDVSVACVAQRCPLSGRGGHMNARTFRLIVGLVIVVALLPVACGSKPLAPQSASPAPPAPVPAPLPEPTPVAPKKPASFRISELTITPGEVSSGSSVTVSVTVSNDGEMAGSHDVILKIDGNQEGKETVTLDGGSNKKVAFTVTKSSAGSYSVSVGDQTAAFTVKAPVISVSTQPAPTPAPVPAGPPWTRRMTANATAANPTWNELINFLISDSTDAVAVQNNAAGQRVFSVSQSLENAITLYNNAEKLGMKSGVVELRFSQGPFYANVFPTSDYGDAYILSYYEDRIARIEKGEPFAFAALNAIKPYDLKNKYAWDLALQRRTASVLFNASLVESITIYPLPAK
ncbi:MAG: hypothetical protein HYX85_01075 [Chloroflexi bacterium]|nr:hypothetical protein [Chloroflexota bacterium]